MKQLRDESGAVAVIVALLVMVFIALSALVVDMGYLYGVRRQLQSAADAAALAGCWELINDKSGAEVLAVANDYALKNGVKPADGLVMLTTPPETEVAEDYVKVTVTKRAPLFFGRVLGQTEKVVAAQAVARVAYATGMRGLVPWCVPVLRARRITAKVAGGVEVELALNDETGKWEGDLPIDMPASRNGYPVTVIAYNSQTEYPDHTSDYPNGVPERLELADSVVVREPTCCIQNVFLSKNVVTAGTESSVVLYVEDSADATSTELPKARFNGRNYTLSPVPGVPHQYSIQLTVPAVDDLIRTFPIDVSIGSDASATSITQAAVLVVRRPTYPIRSVTVQERFFSPDAASRAHVCVELNEYVYGREYELKVVGGGGEVGNFCALDLSTIRRPPYWRKNDPAPYDIKSDPDYGTPVYRHYVENSFPFSLQIGDTVWTEPGSYPQTADYLETRFDGNWMTFEDWEAAGRPRDSDGIVYVPITEKMQITTGSTPMRVVALAAFYVEPGIETHGSAGAIRGRFIEYVAPSDTLSPDPPGEFWVKTPQLTSEHLDY